MQKSVEPSWVEAGFQQVIHIQTFWNVSKNVLKQHAVIKNQPTKSKLIFTDKNLRNIY